MLVQVHDMHACRKIHYSLRLVKLGWLLLSATKGKPLADPIVMKTPQLIAIGLQYAALFGFLVWRVLWYRGRTRGKY